MMIREIATRKSSTGYKGLLLIFIMTVIIVFLSVLVGYVERTFGIKNLEYIIFVILLGVGVFVIYYFVTQYRYSLFDDELIIESILGKKITIVVDVFIWDIVTFDKVENKVNKNDKKITKIHNLSVQHANKWVVTYKKGEEICKAVFNPSNEFVNQLQRAIAQRKMKQQREPDIIT